MICESCAVEIPPSFVAVIAKNICPACEKPIMSDETKQLHTDLKEAMERMPNDHEGLAGWLLSHYRLTKVGTGEPTGFHRPKEQTVGMKIAPNKTQEFLKRTGLSKQIEQRQNHHRAMVEAINNGNIDEFDEDVTDEAEEYAESEEHLEAMHNRKNFKSIAQQIANNSLILSNQEAPPIITAEQMNLVNSVEDIEINNIPQALQESRLERLRKQKEAIQGSGPSSFRRG